MDFLEILDYCAYDVERAHRMAEAMKRGRMAKDKSESVRKECRGLCGSCHCNRPESDVAGSILVIVF